MEIQKVFVEFGGDPSDDKEVYKRYSSTEKFKASPGMDREVIEFVSSKKFNEAISEALEMARCAQANLENLVSQVPAIKHATMFQVVELQIKQTIEVLEKAES